MVFNLFRKSNDNNTPTTPIQPEPKYEGLTFDDSSNPGKMRIQTFKKGVDFSAAGDNIGLILANVKQEEVQIGNLITAK